MMTHQFVNVVRHISNSQIILEKNQYFEKKMWFKDILDSWPCTVLSTAHENVLYCLLHMKMKVTNSRISHQIVNNASPKCSLPLIYNVHFISDANCSTQRLKHLISTIVYLKSQTLWYSNRQIVSMMIAIHICRSRRGAITISMKSTRNHNWKRSQSVWPCFLQVSFTHNTERR